VGACRVVLLGSLVGAPWELRAFLDVSRHSLYMLLVY
jgi:hypothetical protein